MSCGVGCRLGSDPMLWLWHRPAAVAAVQPLAQELLYATGAAIKRKGKKKKRQEYRLRLLNLPKIASYTAELWLQPLFWSNPDPFTILICPSSETSYEAQDEIIQYLIYDPKWNIFLEARAWWNVRNMDFGFKLTWMLISALSLICCGI